MRPIVTFLVLAALATCPSARASNKTYRNPLLPDREIADPFVLRVGGKYYLYPTTDTEGYEVFVSSDLVHWVCKARAFKDPRGGDWAPEVFHNTRGDGKFYLYYTDDLPGPDGGELHKQIGVAVASSPLGPFTDKGVLAPDAIDADLFQDDDGSLYLSYAGLAGGFKIIVQPMADPLHKKGEPTVVIRPTEEWEKRSGEVTEGPFMLKHKGIYYLMYSGTGADSPNYGIGYATSQLAHRPLHEIRRQPDCPSRRECARPGPSLRHRRPRREALARLSPKVGRRARLPSLPGD